MTKHLFLSAALALAAALPGVAQASPGDEVSVLGQRLDDRLTERVDYADLDLQAADGRSRLMARVRGAVREVCSPFTNAGQLIEHGSCRSFAWTGARPQIRQAIRQAQLAARTGSATAAIAIVIAAPSGQ